MDIRIWKPFVAIVRSRLPVWRAELLGRRSLDDPSLRRPTYYGVRLRTGLVFNFGGAPELPVAAACSRQTAQVMVGEPVTLPSQPATSIPSTL